MSGTAQTTHANDASAKPMPGQSKRAQQLLAPRHHPQFTRAVPMPDASLCWPGTWIKRSTDNSFTRPAGPSVAAPVRTERQLAADASKRSVFLSDGKPPIRVRPPRKPKASS